MWKKIKRFLFIWDGIWSVPVSFIMFMAFIYLGEGIYPDGDFSGMSPAYLQKMLYASVIMVGMNVSAWLAIFFNFNKVWGYYLKDSGTDFKNLEPFKKICIVFLLYFAFFWSGLLLVLMPV